MRGGERRAARSVGGIPDQGILLHLFSSGIGLVAGEPEECYRIREGSTPLEKKLEYHAPLFRMKKSRAGTYPC